MRSYGIAFVWQCVVHNYIMKSRHHKAQTQTLQDWKDQVLMNIMGFLDGEYIQIARAVNKAWKEAIRMAEECSLFETNVHDMAIWYDNESARIVWFISTREASFVHGSGPYGMWNDDTTFTRLTTDEECLHGEFAGFKPIHRQDNVVRVEVNHKQVIVCTEDGVIRGWALDNLFDTLTSKIQTWERIFDRPPCFEYIPAGLKVLDQV